MSTNQILSQKEKELIAVGASIAAGCQPCTAHHVQAARAAGVTGAELRQVIDAALNVRRNATRLMAGVAYQYLGGSPLAGEPEEVLEPALSELVALGAALAVNCPTTLAAHLESGRIVGATNSQIQTALGLARSIKKVASEKVEAVAKAASEPAEVKSQPVEGTGCGCQGGTNNQIAALAQTPNGQQATPCGCG